MKELELPELKQYIRNVVDLETSVYEQENTCSYAQSQAVMPDVQRTTPRPVQDYKEELIRPELDAEKQGFLGPAIFVFIFVGCFLGGLVIGSGIEYDSAGLVFLGLFLFTLPSLVFLYFAIKNKIANKKLAKEQILQYEKEMEQYKLACEEADKKTLSDRERYKEEEAEAEKNYQIDLQNAQDRYENAQQSVGLLNNTLQETKETLQEYYDLDVIFPKYRNIVAMSSFLEYFETGRCTELTGPNGAYNLYESELRQDIVIGQLGLVVNQLEQIKQNQFLLYEELNKANKNASEMNYKLNRIMIAEEQTAINSEITAYCAEITASNTTFLSAKAMLE